MSTTSGASRRRATRGGCGRLGPTRPTSSTWCPPTGTCRSRAISGPLASTPATATACPASSSNAKGDQFQKTEGFRRHEDAERSARGPRTAAATSRGVRPRSASRLGARRRRRRDPVPQQGPHDVGDAGRACSARRCAASTTIGPGRRSDRSTTRSSPMACVATADLDGAIAEIQRCAALGFRGPVPAVQARVRSARTTRT